MRSSSRKSQLFNSESKNFEQSQKDLNLENKNHKSLSKDLKYEVRGLRSANKNLNRSIVDKRVGTSGRLMRGKKSTIPNRSNNIATKEDYSEKKQQI